MAHDDIDPLDAQDARNLARQRLRSNLAAALLLDWLLTDVEIEAPEYFSDLESRFQTGFDYAALWRDDPKFDGFVPLHGRDRSTIDFWIHQEDLGELLSRLFPHGPNDAPSISQGRALVVVMLHSALETLFHDLDLKRHSKESIVAALVSILGIAEREPTLRDTLVDLRETRVLIAHCRGRVTDRYRRQVPMTTFAPDEVRLVTGNDIRLFSDAVHRVAEQALSPK
jgi:hypothetical protein